MKISFKNLCIIFLVALLGSGIGVYFGSDIYHRMNPESNKASVSGNSVNYGTTTVKSSDVKAAVDKAIDSVVRIQAETVTQGFFQNETSTSLGSGVIISEDGYIVTNTHVVENAQTVTVFVGDESYQATLVGSDEKSDITVIKIEAQDLPYATFADSSKVEVGDDAIAIGNALGTGISVTNGIISATDKTVTIENEPMRLFQTNAEINSGNSGGGLFDINGDLIGIVNAKTSSSINASASVEGLGYAIPSNTVSTIVDDLMENGYVKNRATMGVTITELTSGMNGFEAGVYVTEIQAGSAAEKAGLEIYDRIIGVDDQDVSSYADLRSYLNSCEVGDTITLKIVRNNQTISVDLTLQENTSAN